MTLVCVLLLACSRAETMKINMQIFESIRRNCGIELRTKHYAFVVD